MFATRPSGGLDLGVVGIETVSESNAVFRLVTTAREFQVIKANGGMHEIGATYSSGVGFSGSSGSLNGGLTVNPAPLTIAAVPNTTTYNSTTMVTMATITP